MSFATISDITTSSIATNTQHLSTFNFEMLDVSMFNNDFMDNSFVFDNALSFQDISPILVPREQIPTELEEGEIPIKPVDDLLNWLDTIPITNPYSAEMKRLATHANAPSPKVVTLTHHIDYTETILQHIKGAAKCLTDFGPAPRMLDEWVQMGRKMDWVCFLIYLQIQFFSNKSLTPWQYTLYTKTAKVLTSYTICPLCNMYGGPWCQDIVLCK